LLKVLYNSQRIYSGGKTMDNVIGRNMKLFF